MKNEIPHFLLPERKTKIKTTELNLFCVVSFSETRAPHLSLLVWRLAIQATVAVVPPHAVVLQDVQHPGHLTEDEYTRTWTGQKIIGQTVLLYCLNYS